MTRIDTPTGESREPPIHLGRFQWEHMLRRAPLALPTKGIAMLAATWGDIDGSSIFPGTTKLSLACRVNEKTVRRHLIILRTGGYPDRVSKHGWSYGGPRYSDEYQLSAPGNFVDLPGVLNTDGTPQTLQ